MMSYKILCPERVGLAKDPTATRHRFDMFKLKKFIRSLGHKAEEAINLSCLDYGLQITKKGRFYVSIWQFGVA